MLFLPRLKVHTKINTLITLKWLKMKLTPIQLSILFLQLTTLGLNLKAIFITKSVDS